MLVSRTKRSEKTTSSAILLFLLISIIIKRGFSKSRSQHRKRPPGPWKLPFLGSIHHLAGQLPFHAFRDLAAQHGPLMLIKIGQVDLAVASSPAAAEEILKNQDLNLRLPPPDRLRLPLLRHRLLPLRPLLEAAAQALLHGAAQHQSFASIGKEETRLLMSDISMSSGPTVEMSEKLSTLTTNKIVSRAAEALDLVLGFYFADVFPSLSFLDYLTGANFKLRVSVDFQGVSVFQYLPFWWGAEDVPPRAAFALATVELTLAQLLLCFDWELPEGMKPEELDMSESFGLVAAWKTELKLLASAV
ncbi:hypothetical protein BHE74_00004913 [Ensete ventricosum]|nr:hypothetical protein GW17_00029396 [Ensete ventricosum]RWW86312.1 hypothetical protein BHE74_00004913 [Ensete ventricosum]